MKADFTPLLTMIVVACATVLPVPYVQEAQAAPSVVGLWRFNEGSGTNAFDSSGLGNNGTLTGENGNVPAWVAGQSGFGSALRFTNNGIRPCLCEHPRRQLADDRPNGNQCVDDYVLGV